MWCMACTSRIVNQRPEGFVYNQLNNESVGLLNTLFCTSGYKPIDWFRDGREG